ncbi:unnamed protein product [Mytilus coruscus]|uniref:Uncharacterized protein n=1 Tax=Mytilus coruscus TaxID=42192 RepID=A0A6J8ES84_MYTCO|nr:unnamed protein product [Mytilus coruscus]
MNWTRMAIKYNVTLNGKLAGNGGQILKQFAKDNNIDIHRFNPHLMISGRTIFKELGGQKASLQGKLAIPNKRTAKNSNRSFSTNWNQNLRHWPKIAPKEIRKNTIDSSGSKDTEQVSYTPTRTEDLEELRKGIIFDGIPYTFQLRFFSGDGPARQFEAGQQRGGNFSCLCGVHSKEHMNLECCFKRTPSDLEDRRAVFLKGESLVKIKQGNINPFQNLTKDELIEELECRGFDTFRLKTKARLQEEMSDLLHGISRPPALLLHYPEKSLTESNISCYEVLPKKPLHDIFKCSPKHNTRIATSC